MASQTAGNKRFIVRLDIEVKVTDPDALERCALERLDEVDYDDDQYVEEERDMIREGPETALMSAIDGLDLIESLEGVECTGTSVESIPISPQSVPVLTTEVSQRPDPEETREKRIEQFFHDAKKVTGMELAMLGYDDELEEPQRARSLRQAKLLAGCLWSSSYVVIDELFMDIRKLGQLEIVTADDISATLVLDSFPHRFAHLYSLLFAQRMMALMIDLTSRLSSGWEPPSCVAQELALVVLLDSTEVSADLWELDLARDWRADLEETLFEDMDHEFLFDRAWDGFEDDLNFTGLGMAPMKFEDWFTPFTGRHLPPYAQT